MLSIDLKTANPKSFTLFFENVVKKTEKRAGSRKYILIKRNFDTIDYVKNNSISCVTPLSEKEFTIAWWKLFREISCLEDAIRAKNALEKIKDLGIFPVSPIENILNTFMSLTGLQHCFSQINTFSMLSRLTEDINDAFEVLNKAKNDVIISYNEEIKEGNLPLDISFKSTITNARKAIFKLHPDRNPDNITQSTEASIRFLGNYTTLQDLLGKIYRVSAEKLDELIIMRV